MTNLQAATQSPEVLALDGLLRNTFRKGDERSNIGIEGIVRLDGGARARLPIPL